MPKPTSCQLINGHFILRIASEVQADAAPALARECVPEFRLTECLPDGVDLAGLVLLPGKLLLAAWNEDGVHARLGALQRLPQALQRVPTEQVQ